MFSTGHFDLVAGFWLLATGNWHLANWHLATGNWFLAVIWCLTDPSQNKPIARDQQPTASPPEVYQRRQG
jgi:hypothetical protein